MLCLLKAPCTSLWICQSCLSSFSNPGVSSSPRALLAVIWSSWATPRGSDCVTIIARVPVTRGLEITCRSFTTFMRLSVCERRVRRQRAEQCQGLCFLWLPISCPLFSTAPWLVQDVCMYIHTCTHLTHTKTLKDKERHAGGDARKKEPLTRRWKFRGRIVIILPKPEHFVIMNSELQPCWFPHCGCSAAVSFASCWQ